MFLSCNEYHPQNSVHAHSTAASAVIPMLALSSWNILPGICMSIKHLPATAAGLKTVTSCPRAPKWLKLRSLLSRELDESVSSAPSLNVQLCSLQPQTFSSGVFFLSSPYQKSGHVRDKHCIT